MELNVYHLVTKPSDDGTLGVGNIFKVDDEGFLHCLRAGTLMPDKTIDALKGVEFIRVADIDIEALTFCVLRSEYPVFSASQRVTK